MKRIAFRKLSCATAACVATATYLAAAPPQSHAPVGVGFGSAPAGPGFNAQNNPGVLVGSQASDAFGNPGFSSTNNPGVVGSEFGRTTSADASANGSAASEFGRSTAANAGSNGVDASADGRATAADGSANGRSTAAEAGANGAEHRRSGGGFFGSKKGEVMEEISAGSSRESTQKTERSATSKLFDSSLLYAGISPIPSATPGGSSRQEHGATNNPGLEHMSAQGLEHSEFGLSTAAAAPSPAQRAPQNPAANPVPSAPESRGISPIPRGD